MARAQLANSIARQIEPETSPFVTPIKTLTLYRQTAASEAIRCIYEPGIAIVAQGAKRVLLGDETHTYGTGHFCISSVNLPTIAEVVEASSTKPYLAMWLALDPQMISELIVEGGLRPPQSKPTTRGLVLGAATLPLLNAFQHLIDLLDEPESIAVLAPLFQREIVYRVLMSGYGSHLWQIATLGSQSQRIARAIDWLKLNFMKPLHVDELAASVQMSTSTFHHHFRAVTAMSPLQYQKWLRLHEARKLMLNELLDASTAAFRVGYESASQFGREYLRLFGAPPMRDVMTLRQTLTVDTPPLRKY
ncbi:MAG: AraC family transcriptional regulator [Spongiibacteraceae bacterium]